MKWLGQAGGCNPTPTTSRGYRFTAEIVSHAVSLHHVFSLSLRNVEAGMRNWLMLSM
jgi:transposase-like protein